MSTLQKLRVDTEEIEVAMLKKTFFILTVVIGVYLIINLAGTIIHLWQKQEEIRTVEEELDTLKKQNKDLGAKFEYVQTPEFLEKEVRDRLGLVLPRERQVIIDENLLKATESSKTAQPQNLWTNWQKWLKLFF